LSNYEQNARLIEIASCFPVFPMFWNVASARKGDFTLEMVWWYCAVTHLRGNIPDHAQETVLHTVIKVKALLKKMTKKTWNVATSCGGTLSFCSA